MIREHKMKSISGCAIMVFLSFFSWHCASVPVSEHSADYRGRIAELEAHLRREPADPDALVELGVIHFQTRQYSGAQAPLEKAWALDRQNPKAAYYLGMVLEQLNKPEEALGVYANHTQFSSLSGYGRLMEGRYIELGVENVRRQITDLVSREASLGSGGIVPELIAVYPLDYRGTDKTYAPLRMGLAELIKRDLSQVKSVTLVERVRVQALLDELKFGQSKFIDPATAPRVGKILKAGRIVTGSFDVPERESFLLNVVCYDVPNNSYPPPRSRGDDLENLFRLEKEIVLDLLDQIGIEPTPAERQKIAEIPTRSLEAFLLFSQGMEEEATGNFAGAVQKLSRAVAIDPDFSLAAEELRRAEVRDNARTPERAILTTYEFDPPAPSDGRRLIARRLRALEAGMQSESQPGEDSREPPEEAASAGASVGDLPLPPEPPRP
jgi:tetratricopeptide (TPR) repeat protein